MSNEADRAIKAVLDEFGEAWTKATVWRVQGTAVISHKALERIAARASIRFDVPTVLRAERDEAVMLVVGFRGELREWSVGECLVNVNYRVSGKQAAYVWAMAEKRAKDRVILKLLQLHGLAYSEEEADDLKASRADLVEPGGDDEKTPFDDALISKGRYIAECLDSIRKATDAKSLAAWWRADGAKAQRQDFGLDQDDIDRLKTALTDRLQKLGAETGGQGSASVNGRPVGRRPDDRQDGRRDAA